MGNKYDFLRSAVAIKFYIFIPLAILGLYYNNVWLGILGSFLVSFSSISTYRSKQREFANVTFDQGSQSLVLPSDVLKKKSVAITFWVIIQTMILAALMGYAVFRFFQFGRMSQKHHWYKSAVILYASGIFVIAVFVSVALNQFGLY